MRSYQSSPTCTSPWSAVTSSAASRRQRVEESAHELVRELELACEVLVVQPELVRDGVDPRVVRVHDRWSGLGEHAAVLDQHRRGAPAVERDVAQVRGVNPDVRNSPRVTTGTDRPRNGGVALHAERIGRTALVDGPRRTLSTAPSTRIRNPRMPCWIGARPVVIDVSADAVVDGAMVVMAPPGNAASSGSPAGVRRAAPSPARRGPAAPPWSRCGPVPAAGTVGAARRARGRRTPPRPRRSRVAPASQSSPGHGNWWPDAGAAPPGRCATIGR